ncbi:MAG: TlpA family protein disulfide reductase [Thermaceae bacterium]|nr:TlpA family protein disulfide reductase [Thermaceae bacterium]
MKIIGLMVALLLSGALAQRIGQTAPDFKLADLNGNIVTLMSLQGKPAVITFWASWCTVCKAELPKLHALAREKQIDYYVISREPADSQQVVRAYMKQYPAFTPLISLRNGDQAVDVADRYKILGQPWTFVLNAEGKVVGVQAGAVNMDLFKKELAQAGLQ